MQRPKAGVSCGQGACFEDYASSDMSGHGTHGWFFVGLVACTNKGIVSQAGNIRRVGTSRSRGKGIHAKATP